MAFREIGRQQYDQALGAFRERPGAFKAAARSSGIDKRTAKRLWLVGLPSLGLPPLQQAVEREQQELRAKVAEEERRLAVTRVVAAEDAQRVREHEVLIARGARAAALDLLNRSAVLKAFADRAAQRLAALELDPKADPLAVARVLGALARYNRHAAELALRAIELERLRLGEARKVDVHLTVEQRPFDPEQAARDAELLQEVLRERAARPPPAIEQGAARAQG